MKICGIIQNASYIFRVKNSCALHRTFNVEPLYLQHENSGKHFFHLTIFFICSSFLTIENIFLFFSIVFVVGLAIDYMVSVVQLPNYGLYSNPFCVFLPFD